MSSGIEMSLVARHVGTLTARRAFFSFTSKPRRVKILTTSFLFTSQPIFFNKKLQLNSIGPWFSPKLFTSGTLLTTRAPGQNSRVKATAFFKAILVKLGSKLFSKRAEESV